jgi:hypothetical protein
MSQEHKERLAELRRHQANLISERELLRERLRVNGNDLGEVAREIRLIVGFLFQSVPERKSRNSEEIAITEDGYLLVNGAETTLNDAYNVNRLHFTGRIAGLDSNEIYSFEIVYENDAGTILRCVRKDDEIYWDVPKVLDAGK